MTGVGALAAGAEGEGVVVAMAGVGVLGVLATDNEDPASRATVPSGTFESGCIMMEPESDCRTVSAWVIAPGWYRSMVSTVVPGTGAWPALVALNPTAVNDEVVLAA